MTDNEYRQHLIETYEELSLAYARTLVTLAGGALGLSLTFAKEIIGSSGGECRWILVTAWGLWTVALTSVLIGFYCGREAARYAREQYDDGKLTGENKETPGGKWTGVTHKAGLIGLVTFVFGVAAFVIYVSKTLG
ncbi:MAG: hypothetical protein IIA11_07725 [Proteobacteria bacterium]|nr:hypothetical protein [Pseudomonadota bacterium]